jgi:hypothetical protein
MENHSRPTVLPTGDSHEPCMFRRGSLLQFVMWLFGPNASSAQDHNDANIDHSQDHDQTLMRALGDSGVISRWDQRTAHDALPVAHTAVNTPASTASITSATSSTTARNRPVGAIA